MAQTVFDDLDQVRSALGTHLGYSDWLEVDQERVDLFADATGDHQWIHVDPERAAAGPFGAPIAHGYLTLSISNYFLPQIVEVRNISLGVNYGLDKVRFPAPVKIGSRVRAGAELTKVEEVKGGIQTTMVVIVEVDGSSKPACVIESVSRFLA